MIKTFNINLAGQIFNINEDAYEHLSAYFNSLRNFYKNDEEKDEIIRDIESRFAELFLAKGKNYIITSQDAVEVVNMMGNPSEFDGDHAAPEKETTETVYTKKRKRLYRDTDASLVSGVCAGISNFIGISDPIWVRLAFILLTIFTFGFWMLLIYPILWFVIPEAITSTEKLEMKGEAVTLSNIQKTVRVDSTHVVVENKSIADKIMSFLGACVKIFFKFLLGVVLVILGALLVCIVAAIICLFIALIIFSVVALFAIPAINQVFFVNASDGWFLGIGALLIAFTPIIFIVLALVHVLSKKSKPLTKRIVFPLFGLFMFGLLLLNISGFHAKQLTAEKKRVTQTFPMNYDYKSDTLQIAMNTAIPDEKYNDVNISGVNDLMEFINEHEDHFIKVNIVILPSATDSFSVVKEYSASGSNDKEAIRNATSFTHTIAQRNNKLIIDPYIQFDENSKPKFRNQKLTIKVYVPEGKIIRWDERTERYMKVKNLAFNWDNIRNEEEFRKNILIKVGKNNVTVNTPPMPPLPPSPPSVVTIKIDPDKDVDQQMEQAQEKLDRAREKLERAQEKMEEKGMQLDDRQQEMLDSINEIIDTRFQREHYIFKMVNGELVPID